MTMISEWMLNLDGGKMAEWITAIATAVTALGVLFMWRQTNDLRRQLADDHERSRRQNAIELIVMWTERLQRHTSSARKLVEGLPEDVTRALVDQKEIRLPNSAEGLLRACIGEPAMEHVKKDANTGTILVDEHGSATLRWQVMTYLNALEAVMASWLFNVADRKMLEAEFGYLVDETKGYNALHKFRTAAGGGDAFPAIEAFAEELRGTRRKSQQPVTKGPLGRTK